MSQADLLTDEDIRTRNEPPKGWFNQYLCSFEYGVECVECGKSLADKPGEIFFSCCPAVFFSYQEAVDNARENELEEAQLHGKPLAEYMGTFEL